MITVTRLNGPAFALNPDLIERIETTPDTVITLVDGAKYVVRRERRRARRTRPRVEGGGHRAVASPRTPGQRWPDAARRARAATGDLRWPRRRRPKAAKAARARAEEEQEEADHHGRGLRADRRRWSPRRCCSSRSRRPRPRSRPRPSSPSSSSTTRARRTTGCRRSRCPPSRRQGQGKAPTTTTTLAPDADAGRPGRLARLDHDQPRGRHFLKVGSALQVPAGRGPERR